MAGVLDLVYLVVAVVGAIVGLVYLATVIHSTSSDGSEPIDWAIVAVGVIFLVVLGVNFAV